MEKHRIRENESYEIIYIISVWSSDKSEMQYV